MRPPAGAQIYAPEFPPKMEWLNVAFLRMAGFVDRNAVLIEFFDTARVNSHRTLPYLQGWHARYAGHGLRVIGVHTPGYSFGRDHETVATAVEAMGVEPPRSAGPRLPGVEALRQPGLAGALPVRPARAAALHPLRRGRLRGHRGGHRRAAGRDRGRGAGSARAAAAAAARGCRGRGDGAPDRRRGAARRPEPPGAGRRLDRGRGLPGGRRPPARRRRCAGRAARPTRCCRARWCRDCRRRTGRSPRTSLHAQAFRLHGLPAVTPAPPAPSGSAWAA